MAVKISARNDAVQKSALWLRDYLRIPANQIIFPDYEKYFNCSIKGSKDPVTKWWNVEYIEFHNDQEATLFLLRWS